MSASRAKHILDSKQAHLRPKKSKMSVVIMSMTAMEKNFKVVTDFVRAELEPQLRSHRHIVVHGPVKCGKRRIVQYTARFTQSSNCSHAFISAFHRVSDEDQRSEMRGYGLKVYSKSSELATAGAWFDCELASNPNQHVVIHLDECDYGTGADQCLSKLWAEIRNNPRITTILYSATPDEVLHSGECKAITEEFSNEDTLVIPFHPGPTYCGAAEFIRRRLVHEATPFYMGSKGQELLCEQALNILSKLRERFLVNRRRNTIFLRISSKELETEDAKIPIHAFVEALIAGRFPELAGFLVYLDKGSKFGAVPSSAHGVEFVVRDIPWSDKTFWRREVTAEMPVLVVYDQTCTRSTELGDHSRIFATHDYRKNIVFSTVAQAQQRVNHYADPNADSDIYKEFQEIQVYGHLKTWLYAAKALKFDEYLAEDFKAEVETSYPGIQAWRVVSVSHPALAAFTGNVAGKVMDRHLSRDEAKALLKTLGNRRNVTLSARVGGRVTKQNELKHIFIACPNMEADFDTVKQFASEKYAVMHPTKPMAINIRCPFEISRRLKGIQADGKWLGYQKGAIKGNWNCWQFKEIKSMGDPLGSFDGLAPRRVICYNGEELGIALSFPTGRKVNVSSITTSQNSMYY